MWNGKLHIKYLLAVASGEWENETEVGLGGT